MKQMCFYLTILEKFELSILSSNLSNVGFTRFWNQTKKIIYGIYHQSFKIKSSN